MKISTRGRYALRLMLDLALQDRQEYIPLKQIGERQEVSVKYLEQIINLLAKAGFVQGVRGSKGGYRLAKDPQEYTVAMILRLTEGDLAPVACLEESAPACPRAARCMTLPVWQKLNKAINDTLEAITLADIIQWQEGGNNYVI